MGEDQNELKLSDEELKTIMLERMNHLSTPVHLFTTEECWTLYLWRVVLKRTH